jgi:hypothetical protein
MPPPPGGLDESPLPEVPPPLGAVVVAPEEPSRVELESSPDEDVESSPDEDEFSAPPSFPVSAAAADFSDLVASRLLTVEPVAPDFAASSPPAARARRAPATSPTTTTAAMRRGTVSTRFASCIRAIKGRGNAADAPGGHPYRSPWTTGSASRRASTRGGPRSRTASSGSPTRSSMPPPPAAPGSLAGYKVRKRIRTGPPPCPATRRG